MQEQAAVAMLRSSVNRIARRLRKLPSDEMSRSRGEVLARIDLDGPMTSEKPARAEGVTPQSMGITVGLSPARSRMTAFDWRIDQAG